MTARLNPYLSFRNNAREAMEFYKDVFGGELTVSTFADFQASQTSDSPRAEVRDLGRLKPVEPMARRMGVPLLGAHQVYVMKHGWEYHTAWCQVVADKWGHVPGGLLVTLLADVGARTPCRECDRPLNTAG
ncbi:hypothetical protein [Arthrobacter sp. NicSoilB8]|uniref:hypothetical protein n=1 Tax=Arthrobacter sp. NicSoilB8 TaxID=2830998 RepID=UPI001CC3F05B|nr:hypothetical protein [Arthrobacter sp. NicSoilB8]BCW70949.1 hypothetical protein NicSoilB8_19930 [Arthrobacter sp. NicSoilB8]